LIGAVENELVNPPPVVPPPKPVVPPYDLVVTANVFEYSVN
jgi:hypothetical protein